jgi:VWFA-related protein
VNATYTALIQLAARIAPLPGRKTVVWVTHGVPLHGITASDVPVDYLPTLKKIAAGISRESIVFYPVQQTAGALPGPGDTSPDTLQQFASITGGRVYANQTVDKALPEIMRDIAAAYILTYRAASTPEAQFHSLRLTSTRPGARMQFPQGH